MIELEDHGKDARGRGRATLPVAAPRASQRRPRKQDVSLMTFPSDWPPGCPPSDSEAADGVVYRIAKSSPPGDDDFLSQSELGRKRGDECLRRALSVFRGL